MCSSTTSSSSKEEDVIVLTLPKGGGFQPWRRPVGVGLAVLWIWYFCMYQVATYVWVSASVMYRSCLGRNVFVCFLTFHFIYLRALVLWVSSLDATSLCYIRTFMYYCSTPFSVRQIMEPLPEFCDNVGLPFPCQRPDLMAFQLTALVLQVYMGAWGLYGWHVWWPTRGRRLLHTPALRTMGRLRHAEYLCAGILAFQVWDFMASCLMPEHFVPEFLIHHVLTATTAYLALEFQMVHHYAIFFGGCSEISSIALVWVDLDRYFPASVVGSDVWTTFIVANQGMFVLAFCAYRLMGWMTVSVALWRDVRAVLPTLAAHYRPGKVWFLRVFLGMDVALGALQVYWFATGLLPAVLALVRGQEE